MMAKKIVIRQLNEAEQLIETGQLIRLTWNMEPIPLHQALATIKNGGLILGAYMGEKMVGFTYSFPGFAAGRFYLCSHLLAVLPPYRGKNIGELLKQEQAKLAQELGYSLIKWTFDPLESRNAHLNLNKLRARGVLYSPNHYGELTDDINKDLPSDRLIIEWSLNDQPLERTKQIDEQFLLLKSDINQSPVKTDIYRQLKTFNSEIYFIEIPTNIQVLKQGNIHLANQWRLATREVFITLFNRGYEATDIILKGNDLSSYYVLRRIK